jgi:uncharacterized protein YyaL (SSP411 family)
MEESARSTKVAWLEWGSRAFRAAAHLDRPVLLSISTPWCRWCHEMDAEAYSDPGLAANINDGFVPVRVDADRRPRIRERYATGGFPSTVFLTPAGTVIAGAGHLEIDGFRRVLNTVRERWEAAGTDAGRIPRAVRDQSPPNAELDGRIERLLTGQLEARWDDANGGWGSAEKFPLPETIRFALKREQELATRALDLVIDHLQAPDGAVHRYAQPDWSSPTGETLTDTTGGILSVLAHAYCRTGEPRFADAASSATGALTGPLWADGAVAASRGDPDDSRAPGPEGVDWTMLADRNAVAATGLLWQYAYTDDERARTYAVRLLETLATVTESGLVAHHDGAGAPRGLLGDQARLLEAHVTAAQVLGSTHLGSARTIADATLETLHSEGGAFLDGPPSGAGLLDRPLRPLDGNAAMADGLLTLAELTDTDRYHSAAVEALSAFAGAADRIGVQAAIYGTAASRAVEGPLVIAVADDVGSPLHRAALRVADHEKVVVPQAEGPGGTAWLRTAAGASGRVESPGALEALVRDHVA